MFSLNFVASISANDEEGLAALVNVFCAHDRGGPSSPSDCQPRTLLMAVVQALLASRSIRSALASLILQARRPACLITTDGLVQRLQTCKTLPSRSHYGVVSARFDLYLCLSADHSFL